MKGNKKILLVAILLLLIAVSYGTYAIYKSSATSSDSVRPAHWVVEVNDTNISTSNSFTLDDLDCGSTPVAKAEGTIAPGDTCTATVVVDATGSEVNVDYTVEIDPTAVASLANDHIAITADNGHDPLTGTIAYSTTADAMVKTVVLNITWTAEDETGQNAEDIATANLQNVSIPVTVTAVQNPNPAPTATPQP